MTYPVPPNIQLSNNPAVLDGGQFGAVIDASQGVAALVTGDLTVQGTIISTGQINAGNLILANASLIIGDFTNVANRPMFQTNVINGATFLQVIPNGTAVRSGITFENVSGDDSNANYLFTGINAAGTASLIGSFGRGSAVGMPMYLTAGPLATATIGLALAINGNVSLGASGKTVGFYGNYGVTRATTPAATVAPTLGGVTYATDSAAIQTALNDLTTEVNALRTIIANLNLSA